MVTLLALLGLGGGGYYAYSQGLVGKKAEKTLDYLTAPVTKSPLEIRIVERGNLESANNVTLSCMVEGESGTGILKIVEEGA
ncbi:MAG: hypothetical protein ACKO3P_23405, partial [Planctomycetaceae bacterium]